MNRKPFKGMTASQGCFIVSMLTFVSGWIWYFYPRSNQVQVQVQHSLDGRFWGLVVIACVTGGCLVAASILTWKSAHAVPPSPPLPIPAAVPLPPGMMSDRKAAFLAAPSAKLAFRVIDAIAGPSVAEPGTSASDLFVGLVIPRIEVILKLRMINREEPPTTLSKTDWTLEMRDGEGKLMTTAYGQVLHSSMRFEREREVFGQEIKTESFDKDLVTELSKIPIDIGIPAEGWARFTTAHLRLCHAFGAQLLLTVKDDNGITYTFPIKSGQWLIPAKIFYADASAEKK